MPDVPPKTSSSDARWSGLFKLGGGASIAIAVLLLAEFAVYAMIPDPGSLAEKNLELFIQSPLAGLLSFDLLGMAAYILFIPAILALYIALHRYSEAAMLVATALFFVGIADFFATNTGFPMLSLSNQYALASTPEEQQAILASSQAMIAVFEENAFLVSYVIVSFSWFVISLVMFRSRVFGRITATMGILAGTAGVVAVVLEHITFINAVTTAIAIYFLAIVFLMLWVFLSGTRLLRLGDLVSKESA